MSDREFHPRRILEAMNPPVFLGSGGVILLFILFGTLFSKRTTRIFQTLQDNILALFGGFYIGVATVLVVVALGLALSSLGSVKLGKPEDEAEFSFLSWFSMMMSAGMGIGIVYFGVAEPLKHYLSPPLASPETPAALAESMRFTFFHWGLHPWAIYTAIALPLGYFHFRHDLPLAPRSMLYPILGENYDSVWGDLVDILCTVGTLFGVATSLGFGAIQMNAGLHEIAGLPQETVYQVAIVLGVTGLATLSVVSGIKNGVRVLSKVNMMLAGALLLFVLVAGPTLFIFKLFFSSVGSYLQNLPAMSVWLQPGAPENWQADWTLFYWSWWISWSPFVGIFTARISKGRTVREFVLTALFAPTLLTFFWFSAIGGTALQFTRKGEASLAQAVEQDSSLALYALLDQLPGSLAAAVLATVLILIFFVTSSDSGSLVDDMVTSGGHPDPPKAQRVFWALCEGGVAATLLLAGGLKALRTASLTTGLPLAFLLLLGSWGLFVTLRKDAQAKSKASYHT